MKRVLSMAIAIAVAGTISGHAQTVKRIQFPKGRSSTVIRGTTAQFGAAFVLRARSGQKLVLDLSPASGVGIKVETVGSYGQMVLLREEGGGRYEIGLEETGDYTIFLGPLGHDPVSFTLGVKITKLADV